jgi:hypothetical protein
MIFGEYITKLQQLLFDNPDLINAEVAYATDDEGNSYCTGVFDPSIRYRPADQDGYTFDTALDKDDLEDHDGPTVPVVLIN